MVMDAHLQKLDDPESRSPADCREGESSDGRNPDLAEAERLVMDAEMEERDRLEEAEERADESRPQETEFAESQQKSGPNITHALTSAFLHVRPVAYSYLLAANIPVSLISPAALNIDPQMPISSHIVAMHGHQTFNCLHLYRPSFAVHSVSFDCSRCKPFRVLLQN